MSELKIAQSLIEGLAKLDKEGIRKYIEENYRKMHNELKYNGRNVQLYKKNYLAGNLALQLLEKRRMKNE